VVAVSTFDKRSIATAFLLAAALVATPLAAARAEPPADPTASVGLTSKPGPGDVSGPVTFTATGRSPGQQGYRGQMNLYVDDVDWSFKNCIEDPCTATFEWGPNNQAGTHTVQAVYNTSDGQVAKSQILSFRAYTGTHIGAIGFSSYEPGAGKRTVTVTVYDSRWNRGVAGMAMTVTLTPAIGKPTTHTATSRSDGSAKFTYTFRYNTKISVVVAANNRWGPSTHSETFTLQPTWSCSLADTTVKHGHPDSITCTVPGLPAGTKVDLAFADGLAHPAGYNWVTLAKGHSGAGRLTLAFTPKKKGKTLLRVRTKGARVLQDSSTTARVKVT